MTKKKEMDLILKIVDRGYDEMCTYGLYKEKFTGFVNVLNKVLKGEAQ